MQEWLEISEKKLKVKEDYERRGWQIPSHPAEESKTFPLPTCKKAEPERRSQDEGRKKKRNREFRVGCFGRISYDAARDGSGEGEGKGRGLFSFLTSFFR